ncbi:MAG: hypothetical protein ACKN9V_09260 [Pseudomonadota bacterium]
MKKIFFHSGFLLAVLLTNAVALAKDSEGVVICVHPKCEELKHTANLGPDCRSVTGHGGVWNDEKTHLDVCADCKKEHEAEPNLCQTARVSCRKKRPIAD